MATCGGAFSSVLIFTAIIQRPRPATNARGIDRRRMRQQCLADPRAMGPESANKLCPDSKPRNPGTLHIPAEGRRRSEHIETLYVDRPQFATLLLPPISTDFYPDGNSPGKTLENSGKQNPKMGFKSPTEQRRKSSRPQETTPVLFSVCRVRSRRPPKS
jgi:hypothetical protein